MNFISEWILTPILYGISYLPFSVLHLFSDFLYLVIYKIWHYRVKVVRENLKNSFPEKTPVELLDIEQKFYRGFCDLIFETIKMFTISKEELMSRCECHSPEIMAQLPLSRGSVSGITCHLANWEWMGVTSPYVFPQQVVTVYKPLESAYWDQLIRRSRERFGVKLVPTKKIREVLADPHDRPITLAMLADQAPHDYSKAFRVRFLNQDTYVAPGTALITLKQGFVPVFGWVERVGRSRTRWFLEFLDVSKVTVSEAELLEVPRLCAAHALGEKEIIEAMKLTKLFTERLEQKIKMAPQDWLWSHRRWKKR
jgi:KDO2-lipid IV(A) lauroyltransferase